MKTKKLRYEFDPEADRLAIFDGDKNLGGFIGKGATREFLEALERGAEVSITNRNNAMEKSKKVQRLRAIWISQGIDNHRESILEGYGVTSTADLNVAQLDELIRQYSTDPDSYRGKPASEDTRNLRSSILTLLTRLGVYTTQDDWDRVNQYLLDKRIAGKLMYQCTDDELRILKRKLHNIVRKNEEDLKQEKRSMRLN
jgi:hypothetical protein